MAMVDQLLFIKTFRERQAETVLQRSRLSLAQAHQLEEQAQHELERFIAQATEDELRWYRQLCERVVKLRDIEDVQTDVAILRAEEAERARARDAATQQREQAQSAFTQASQQMKEASTARNKFEELARQHHALVAKEVERKEDLELEELAGIVREREEVDLQEHG